ncbi:MAG: STAS domain-containing protein [Rhodanobacteraceae bacterium]
MSRASGPAAIERSADGGVRITGALGFANAGALLPQGIAFTSRGRTTDVDLSGLTDADSATLALLLAWSARATQIGGRLRYRGAPVGLRALARLAEVEPLLGLSEQA